MVLLLGTPSSETALQARPRHGAGGTKDETMAGWGYHPGHSLVYRCALSRPKGEGT